MFGSDGSLTKRFRRGANANRNIAAYLISRADAARDARDWERAASWYEEALQLVPRRADIHVQRGHMLKESGALDSAEAAYRDALAITPDDADLALQFGHLHKIANRIEEARDAYKRALLLKPGWDAPLAELDRLAATAPEPLPTAA